MILTEIDFLKFLDSLGILYQRIEHPPVYTCEQAEQFRPKTSGVSTKNLFLTDKKKIHFYLVMTACEKHVDIRKLGQQLGASKLHFASETKLMEYLGVIAGAVTVLGLVNDVNLQVALYVDAEIWDADLYLCHPLVNTSTLVLKKSDLEKFFEITRHSVNVLGVPSA
jgi:Ala-tRNA(Pro) deacylase